jgi:hypothetical protein
MLHLGRCYTHPCIFPGADLNEQLAVLYAKRFIQRRDVKAVQFSNGSYSPDRELKNLGHYGPVGFGMNHLLQHLSGQATYGHYLLDAESNCRMFAFDVDLEKDGWWSPMDTTQANEIGTSGPIACNPREEWANRASPARPWLKTQLGFIARKLTKSIQDQLNLPCAAAYSGSKGIHVYGFTDPMPAEQVRAAAVYALETTDDWELFKGQHFYRHKLRDPEMGYPNVSIEIFPKQDSLDGKDLGNLMRLPLGRNLKSNDPCFFIDFNTPIGVLAPHPNPVGLLESGNPYL